MKAMALNEYGDNAEFQLTELPRPSVKTGHVVVRVAATSVNMVDTMIRQMGKDLPLSPDLPAVLGMDFAGTIEAVGEGVTDFEPGDEVYGCAGGLADLQGTLAEYMLYDHKREEHGAILAKLAEIVDAGGLKPLLDETPFGLEEVGKAHDRLTSGQAIGKVVVEI